MSDEAAPVPPEQTPASEEPAPARPEDGRAGATRRLPLDKAGAPAGWNPRPANTDRDRTALEEYLRRWREKLL